MTAAELVSRLRAQLPDDEYRCALCDETGLLPVPHWGRLATPCCCSCAECQGVHDDALSDEVSRGPWPR